MADDQNHEDLTRGDAGGGVAVAGGGGAAVGGGAAGEGGAPAMVTPAGGGRGLLARARAAVPGGGSSLKARAVRGSIWTIGAFGFGQVVSLASNLALAYYLFPAAFGLMSLVKVVTQGLKMFSDIGIGPSIIQNERGEDPAFLNTAWTIQAVRGVCLWLGACALAWPAATFYNAPDLLLLLPVCGFAAVLGGFQSTAMFTANRKLMLRPLMLLGLVSQLASAGVMVLLAWLTGSVWSLVAGWFVANIITLVASHVIFPQHRHRLAWDPAAARQLFKFGKWIFLSTAITFFAGQMDRLMLGKLVPLAELGLYSLALPLVMMASAVCGQLAGVVLFPVLSASARTDPAGLDAKMRRARGLILPVTLLAIVGVICGAPLLFEYLYQDDYRNAGWIAQLLSLPIWFTVLQLSADRAVLAVGDSRPLAVSNLCKLLVTAVGCYMGYLEFGLPGFIVGVAIGTIAGHVVIQSALLRRGINILWQDVGYTALIVPMGLAAALLPRLAGGGWTARPDLLATVVVGAALLGPMGVWTMLRLKREVLK